MASAATKTAPNRNSAVHSSSPDYARAITQNSLTAKKHRGCTKYVTIPDDLRLSIDRDNPRFKRVYALRSECERYNSRLKATGQERLWVRNGNSAANLNTIAAITMLAVALAAVKAGGNYSFRALKAAKRSA